MSQSKKPTAAHSWWKRLRWAFFNSLWWAVGIWSGLIGCGSFAFYLIEHGQGIGYWRSLYWAMQVATTTGPGDVTPKTDGGMILFIIYNPLTSVWALLLLGANIVVRQVKNADIFSHKEQEWLFGGIERIFSMLAWCVRALFLLLEDRGIDPPSLPYQTSNDGDVAPLPKQPHDIGEDDENTEQPVAA